MEQQERFENKSERGKLKELVKFFLKEAFNPNKSGQLNWKEKIFGLNPTVGFGSGNPAHVPYIAFLGYAQKPKKGIYPVLLFYRRLKGVPNLIVAYGVSETETPPLEWNLEGVQTVKEFFKNHLGESDFKEKISKKEIKYLDSYVAKSFEISSPEDLTDEVLEEIVSSLEGVIQKFHRRFENGFIPQEEEIAVEKRIFKDLMFEPLQERAFYNALRTKPFIILAGPSGTGKTKIVETFAKVFRKSSLKHILLDTKIFELELFEPNIEIELEGLSKEDTILKIENLRIKDNSKVIFKNLTLEVSNFFKISSFSSLILKNVILKTSAEIEIEPNGNFEIKDSDLQFDANVGIIGKDCSFEAENSYFRPMEIKNENGIDINLIVQNEEIEDVNFPLNRNNEGWKNITLGGNIRGFIKNCRFIGGKGRGESVYKIQFGLNYVNEYSTSGGCLFIYASGEEKFLIKDSYFDNGESYFGGGLHIIGNKNKNVLIENCKFLNCKAQKGGGIYAEYVEIKDSKFENCKATKDGGGIFSWNSTEIKNSIFKNCVAEEGFGGGVRLYNTNDLVENCSFQNCKAKKGGGICFFTIDNSVDIFMFLKEIENNNEFENCEPDNVSANC